MGLDVTAAGTVELVEAMTLYQYKDGGGDRHDADLSSFLFNHERFRDRGAPLVDGVYRLGGRRHEFCAGSSYHAYDAWRERLAAMVGIADLEAFWRSPDMARPFAPLLDFADNEGFIGPEVSDRLRRDFEEHARRAVEFAVGLGDVGRWFAGRYADWSSAFAIAAGRGVVVFH